MPSNEQSMSLAVLIDADNTSPRYAHAIFEEIVTLGEANVRRIYGDFSEKRLSGWDEAVQSLAILQQQQRSNTKGKNASDITLVIDAVDLMHKGTLEGFCLVSSDSDFTRLAQRLREEGMAVYGFGEQKTPEAFRNACTRFIYVENLLEAEPEGKTGSSSPAGTAVQKKETPGKARKLIANAIGDPDDDGWENLARVGSRIQGAQPDFDPRSYGCANLSTLVEKSGGFDMRRDRGVVYVRRKAARAKASGSSKRTAA
ncbi:MAG: NYN domain-containing protein [Rhodospirillaceae bacterium]|nr:NYN domain-containing protein [Rhodospirillaceae bacterium]